MMTILIIAILITVLIIGGAAAYGAFLTRRILNKQKAAAKSQFVKQRSQEAAELYKKHYRSPEERRSTRSVDNDFITSDFPDYHNHSSNDSDSFKGFGGGGAGDSWSDSGSSDFGGGDD